MPEAIIQSLPDWDLINKQSGEDVEEALRSLIAGLAELDRRQGINNAVTILPKDQTTSNSVKLFKLETGETVIQVGNAFISAAWSGGSRGPAIVWNDPTNNFRSSWSIQTGTADSLSSTRDALRIIDVVNKAEVFQVTRIGSDYAVHPYLTQADTPPGGVDLGYPSSTTRWRNGYFSGSVTAIGGFSGPGMVPVGSGCDFYGSSLPDNYLWADGTSLSTTTYATLFGVIGYTFGGAGSSFNLPDKRDKQTITKGTTYSTLGTTVGAANHTHSGGTTGAPSGAESVSISGSTAADGGGNTLTIGKDTDVIDATSGGGGFTVVVDVDTETGATSTHTHGAGTLAGTTGTTHTHSGGTTGSADNLFTSLVCNHIIRYQ